MKLFTKKAIPILIGMALPMTAFATNGYFSHGYGLKAKSMGGVGVAAPLDSLAAATNPAGMATIGNRYDLGVDYFRPVRTVTGTNVAEGNGALNASDFNARSSVNDFFIPEIGYNTMLSDHLAVGVSIVGNGGMNSTYRNKNFFDVGPTKDQNASVGVDLSQLIILPTLAYKIHSTNSSGKVTATNSFGVSPILAYQVFKAFGLGDFGSFGFSKDPNYLTDKGHETSYGAGIRLGWQGHFFDDRLSLGATWASKAYMTPFEDYRGLFAEGGDFDIPENYAIGITMKPTQNLLMAFDIEKILYSEVASIGNRTPPSCFAGVIGCTASQPVGENRLGGDTGLGFGWRDMTVYKLGIAYQSSKQWTWRGGFNYGESPIPNDQLLFNLLAPGTVEAHLTLGFTYSPDSKTEWTVSYMHAFNNKQTCAAGTIDISTNPATGDRGCETLFSSPGISTAGFERPAGVLTAEMAQNSLGIAYGRKF